MKNKLITIALLFCSFFTFSYELVESRELFTNSTQELGQLSPDGKYFSYIRREDNRTFIEFVNLDTFEVAPVLILGESIRLLTYTWLNDDTIYFDTKGQRADNEYLLTFSEKETDYLAFEIQHYELKDGYLVDKLESEPDYVMFAKRDWYKNESELNLYRIKISDLSKGKFQRNAIVDEGDEDLIRYFYDSNVRRIIGVFYDRDSEELDIRLSYRELDNKKWHLLLAYTDEDYQMSPIAFIDDKHLAVLSNKTTDKVALHSFNIQTQELEELIFEHQTYDLTNAWLNKSGKAMAVEFYQGGLPQRELLVSSDTQFDERLKATFENSAPLITDVGPNSKRVLVFLSGSQNPGQYFLYDSEKDSMTPLLSMFPELDGFKFATSKSFKVEVEEGVEVEAYLTRPVGLDHNVMLVMPHGGPIGVRDDSLFNRQVQFLANRGFTILQVNFRGSAGYGKSFQSEGVGQFGQLIEKDITAVVSEVLQQESFRNICAMGASYGAYSSVMLANANPETYDCIVASFGVYDLPLLFNYSNYRSGEEFAKRVSKVVGENSPEKLKISPVYNVDDIQVPILLIAGLNDTVTGFEQSNRMRYLLEKKNKNFEHLFYKNAGHGHNYWGGDQHEMASTIDFLYRQLNIPYPDSALLSTQSKKALSADFVKMASYFYDDEILFEDKAKFLELIQKGVAYGSGEANYELANFYLSGTQVELDHQKALELYQTAAENDYAPAALKLGRMYSEGLYLKKDDAKALSYLELALALDDNFVAQVSMARFYCIANKPYRNIEKCHAGLKKAQKEMRKGDEARYLNNSIAQTAIYGRYSADDKQKMELFLADIQGLNAAKFEVNVKELGIFNYEQSDKYYSRGKYEVYDEDTISSYVTKYPERELLLGIQYKPDIEGFEGRQDVTMSTVVWRQYDKDGKLTFDYYQVVKNNPIGTWQSFFIPQNRKAGDYVTMSIYDGTGELRFEHRFK